MEAEDNRGPTGGPMPIELAPPCVDGERPIHKAGAFGGFLDRSLRRHDYQLGRRNCQRFLQRHFVLPMDSELFREWDGRENWAFPRWDGDALHLPIIPLVGRAREAIPKPSWHDLSVDVDRLLDRMETRFDALYGPLLKWMKLPWIARAYLALVRYSLRANLRAKAKTYLEEELDKARILSRPL